MVQHATLPEPAEFSLMVDPSWIAKQLVPLETRDSAGRVAEPPRWLNWIRTKLGSAQREAHLRYLRREALRMRASVDVNTLVSLLLGRIEFRYTPDDPLLQTVFERIYHQTTHPLWELALRDYIITGLGGVSLSPLGVHLIRPEYAVAYPNWHRPNWTARVALIGLERAKKLFKSRVWAQYESSLSKDRSIERARYERDELLGDECIVPIIEVMDANTVRYFFADKLLTTLKRESRYGHFILIGEERVLQEGDPNARVDSSQGYAAYCEQWERYRTGYAYGVEGDPQQLELPVGMIEQCVRTLYRGYNLYEAHEKITESLMKEVLKGRYALYQFDVFDDDSEAFHEFEEIYNAIGYNAPDPSAKPPVTFLGGVNLAEIQVGLREIENLLTSITGVNPYMLGQVGVTKVASEVVAMQQNTNLRLQQLHERVARVLEPFVRAFQLYLIMLPAENQTVIIEPQDQSEQRRYVVVGDIGNYPDTVRRFYETVSDIQSYESFFSRARIELAYTGQISLMERRQNYMQALQMLGSMMQVLMQMGEVYQLGPLVDRILKDLGVDIRHIKPVSPPFQQQLMSPTQGDTQLPPEAQSTIASLPQADMLSVPNGLPMELLTGTNAPMPDDTAYLDDPALAELSIPDAGGNYGA